MMRMLTTFAALSMAGTVILSLLPEGGIKRTAGMAVGLITLLCWAEGIAALLGIELPSTAPGTLFMPTATSLEDASAHTSALLTERWEVTP